jgi:hypothetical protein
VLVLSWNDVNIQDLRYYEVQISTTATFANPTTLKAQDVFRSWDGGTASTTYYARVRARNFANQAGNFSTSVSGQIGDVNEENLADSSVSTAKLQNLAVTTGKIALDAIDNTLVADDAIQTENILDGAVTARSATVTAGTVVVNSATMKSMVSTGLTTTGDDVKIWVVVGIRLSTVGTDVSWELRRDATVLKSDTWQDPGDTRWRQLVIQHLDEDVAAASVTYALYAQEDTFGGAEQAEMKVMEIIVENQKK